MKGLQVLICGWVALDLVVLLLIHQLHPKLNLAGRECGIRLEEILRLLIIRGIRNAIHSGPVRYKRRGLGSEPVRSDGNSLVIAVEQIEGIGCQFQPVATGKVNFAYESQVG